MTQRSVWYTPNILKQLPGKHWVFCYALSSVSKKFVGRIALKEMEGDALPPKETLIVAFDALRSLLKPSPALKKTLFDIAQETKLQLEAEANIS